MSTAARPGGLAAAMLLSLALSFPLFAQETAWRTIGGGFSFRWDTGGEHGHTEECRDPACDDADWRRGNLDNAIGWRFGLERPLLRRGRFALVAGGEAALLFAEYNQSQRDFTILGTFATGGADLDLGPLRPLLRLGAGGAGSSDGRGGAAWFWEAGFDVRLAANAALRLVTRRAELAGPGSKELSLLVVAAPGAESGAPRWDIGWAWGGTVPGGLAGNDLELSRAPLWRLSAARHVGSHGDRLGFSLGATSHESKLYSMLGEAPGNQRGKWVIDLGGRWDRVFGGDRPWRWRLGAGVKAASYFDEDAPFLVDENGETVSADWEVGVTGGAGADVRVADRLRLTFELEQVYWPAITLGETRALLGLELSLGARTADFGDSSEGARTADFGGLGDARASPKEQAPREAARHVEPRYCKRLGRDLGALAARPAHLDGKDWRNLGLGLLAIGATMALDEPIRSEVQRHRSAGADNVAEALRPLGHRLGPALLLGGLWIGGALVHRPELAAIGKDGVEASLLTQALIVPALKQAVGRARPGEELGAFELEPFSNFQSFPSGEASQAFTIAAVIAEHTTNGWVEGAAWGLAGVIGLERIYLDRHWTSDVVAGALVGAAVGRWVVRRNARAGAAPVAWMVVPAASRGGVAVRGSLSF